MKKQKHLWKDTQQVPFLHSLYGEQEERKNPALPPLKKKKNLIIVSPLGKKRATIDTNKSKASAEGPQGQG